MCTREGGAKIGKFDIGAAGGNRTHTGLLPSVFETDAYTYSATTAFMLVLYIKTGSDLPTCVGRDRIFKICGIITKSIRKGDKIKQRLILQGEALQTL